MQRCNTPRGQARTTVVLIGLLAAFAATACSGPPQRGATVSPESSYAHGDPTPTADEVSARAVASLAVASMKRHDWTGLYGMFAPEVVGSFKSESEFVSTMETANGDIIDAQLIGSPTMSSGGGYRYFSQGLSLTMKATSGSTTLYLVYEHGRWYVLGSDPVRKS